VPGEVVVEGDRSREALAAAPRMHGLEQLAPADDPVVASQVAQLPPERFAGDRGQDLEPRVATLAANTVVNERDPGARARKSRHRAEHYGKQRLGRVPDGRQAAQATASARTAAA